MASLPLIREILRRLPDRPLWISTVTATGQVTARSRVPEAAGIFYLPYDLPWTVDRVIHRLRPGLFITAETELWPNLVWRLHRYGVPMAMVNGRISDRSYPRYRRFRFLFSPVVRCFDLLCMQSALSARRVRAMGALPERVRVAGNLKFDQPIPDAVDSRVWRGRLGIRGEALVWVAGSTHPGEEEAILRVFARVREHHPNLRLVVAPRAPERFGEVEALARRMGFSVLRRSEAEGSRERLTDVILLDTIGELAQVYGIAGVGFVGGSLIPKGGQNPLEVAAHGCPVLFGPHMENFREIAALLSEGGGAWEVSGEEMLEDRMMELLGDPRRAREMGARGREVLASHRGAARRTLGMIRPLLERNPWG
jgi:3-deoxy-D-manno-octulosonic-acid transferase